MNEEKIEQISRSTNVISEWSIQLLTNAGIPGNWVKYINLLLMLLVLVLLVFMVQYLTRRILNAALNRAARITGIEFLRHLSERRFPHYLAMIIPFSLVKGSIPIIFDLFPRVMVMADKLVDIFLIFYVIC